MLRGINLPHRHTASQCCPPPTARLEASTPRNDSSLCPPTPVSSLKVSFPVNTNRVLFFKKDSTKLGETIAGKTVEPLGPHHRFDIIIKPILKTPSKFQQVLISDNEDAKDLDDDGEKSRILLLTPRSSRRVLREALLNRADENDEGDDQGKDETLGDLSDRLTGL